MCSPVLQPVIRPVTTAEFDTWLAGAISAYAEDKVACGAWAAQAALEMSRAEHAQLLPLGKDTPDNHIHAILNAAGRQVGLVWFALRQRGDSSIAYVYSIDILPTERRQGHALRALRAVEDEARRLGWAGIALHVFGHNKAAQALYARLGYEPTNINLYKPLERDAELACATASAR